MTKKYYKICYTAYCQHRFFSYAKDRLEDIDLNLPVEYKINEWIYPNVPETKLMVFDTLQHANKWIDQDDVDVLRRYNKIFECEVKKPVKKSIFRQLKGWLSNKEIKRSINKCMKLKKNKKSYLHLCDKPPQGTVFVSAVKLIKEVK